MVKIWNVRKVCICTEGNLYKELVSLNTHSKTSANCIKYLNPSCANFTDLLVIIVTLCA